MKGEKITYFCDFYEGIATRLVGAGPEWITLGKDNYLLYI